MLGPAQVTGAEIKSANASLSSTGQWTVNINFNSQGATAWDTLAQEQFHAIIGIDLDGQVISAPITQPGQTAFSSFGGKVQISGTFTQDQAQTLATELNYGALPVKLDQQTLQTVSASLGQVVAAGRTHLGTDRPRPGHDVHDLLLPPARPGGGVRTGPDRCVAVVDHRHIWVRPRTPPSTSPASSVSSCPSVSPWTPTSSISSD